MLYTSVMLFTCEKERESKEKLNDYWNKIIFLLRTIIKSEAKNSMIELNFFRQRFLRMSMISKRPDHKPFDSFPSDYDQTLKSIRMNI